MSTAQVRRRALLVLGMHRSGTSAVTRVTNLLGADLGANLIAPAPDNPDGFWEHVEAVKIDEDLLEGLGRTWYDMREMPLDWTETEVAREAFERIKILIQRDFAGSTLLAIKDPRMCLTAPLWIEALDALGFEVDCLFAMRDPREVVESLHVRNAWPREPLFLMWVQYFLAAEAATRGRRRALVTYDEILSDWRATMGRVADELDLEWPMGIDEVAGEVDAFLHQGHRHHQASPLHVAKDADFPMPELTAQLYGACLDISRGGTWDAVAKLQEPFGRISELYAVYIDELLKLRWDAEARAQFAGENLAKEQEIEREKEGAIEQAIGHAIEQAKEHVRAEPWDKAAADIQVVLTERLGGLGYQIAELQFELRDLDTKFQNTMGDLQQTLEIKESTIQALFNEISGKESTIQALSSEISGKESTIQALSSEISGRESTIQALSSEISGKESTIQALSDEISGKESTIQALSSEISGRESTIQVLSSEISGKESTIQALSDEISGKESTIQALSDEISGKESTIQALSSEISEKKARVDELIGSTSWKITAPLRWARSCLSPRRWKAALGRTTKRAYQRIPLPTKKRLALKGAIFRALAPVLRNTRSYRIWQAYEAHTGQNGVNPTVVPIHHKPVMQDVVSSRRQRPEAAASRLSGDFSTSITAASASDYVALDERAVDVSRIDVRAIAFYLPQFHPIPENDEWWGRGFTEWTNVSKAAPQFAGHYQPHLPGELGFYDLRVVDVMRRQVELAKHYGLQGFCFHYYWFAGQRLLERPLDQFLANKDIDFPFCICWANENWTRRWDGLDQEVLIGQNYSPEDDEAFISALEPLLRDPRYIRVDGRPLIILYRPSILPDAAATLQRWREHCRKVGIGELYLAMVQFDVEDPRTYGFDVAIEFPPHKLARGLNAINDSLQVINPDYSGHVIEYGTVIQRARDQGVPPYNMIRGVFPSWDNEARKPGSGYTFANATPQRYREWLDLAIDYARCHPVAGDSLVFINAWNEWAEGAHLEPDRRYGYAFLQQTRNALLSRADDSFARRRVVIVSHDAHPHGAQYLALNMARVYRQTFKFDVDVILLGEGRLTPEFSRWATVHNLSGHDPQGDEAIRLAEALYHAGARQVIANTTVAGLLVKTLKRAGMTVVSLVHELSGVIKDNELSEHAQTTAEYADRVVFPAEQVRREFAQCTSLPTAKTVIRPQGLYKLNRFASKSGREKARQQLRCQLGIPSDAKIVLCVGYADHRKGVDLFVESGIRLMRQRDDVHYVWVGHADVRLQPQIEDNVNESGFRERFHFMGLMSDTDTYYAGADVYALTSREDPFPSVVMESLQVGVPVVGFKDAGGFAELLSHGGGRLVPMMDVALLTSAIADLLKNERLAQAEGEKGRALVETDYSFRSYLFDLLELAGAPLPKVSVIVPNYNYAGYIASRIESVLNQQIPFYELIVLDDASTDNSVDIIEQLAAERGVHLRLVRNEKNSGSVFRQWEKGVALARGEYIWIAEADDLAESEFLGSVMSSMSDSVVVMAYCESKQIDGEGHVLAENYHDYTKDISIDHWRNSCRQSGRLEIERHLAIKNTVPNVSAVVFRRDALKIAMAREQEHLMHFRVAGDWLIYTAVLDQGDIAFVSEGLNLHRRHKASVTIGGDNRPHMAEILRMQRLVRERYSVPDDVLRRAQAYVDTLCGYFDLSEDDVARLAAEVEQEFMH